MLHAVRYISCQEPCIWVCQEVINCVTFWDRTVVLDSVDVVISSRYTQFSFQQACCNELQCWWDYQFTWFSSDQQTTFVSPSCDLNNCIFQCCFVQVSCDCRNVGVGTASNKWVSVGEQRYSVTTVVSAS